MGEFDNKGNIGGDLGGSPGAPVMKRASSLGLNSSPDPKTYTQLNNLPIPKSAASPPEKGLSRRIEEAIDSITDQAKFHIYYAEDECFQQAVNRIYKSLLLNKASTVKKDPNFEESFIGRITEDLPVVGEVNPFYTDISASRLLKEANNIDISNWNAVAAATVYNEKLEEARQQLSNCLRKDQAKKAMKPATPVKPVINPENVIKPFDRRMDRLHYINSKTLELNTPFDTGSQVASTIGYMMSEKTYQEKNGQELANKADEYNKSTKSQRKALRQDDFYIGLPSLINPYSITKLYGSKGGEFLLDQVGSRAWYEIDGTNQNNIGFTKNPNTTSLISWGNSDPYGRTPYHFTDFAFCKYWNIIPNNRMITLRRFAAPIYDNMKFPGMDGLSPDGLPSSTGDNDTEIIGVNGSKEWPGTSTNNDGTDIPDGGSGKKVDFPPMATAITYFGEETGNKISELLKFTTGFNWDEAKADLWNVSPTENPDMEKGPGAMFGGLSKYAKMFNIAAGTSNTSAVLNQGMLPPDPYTEGPYENRIIGPVNRITAVKKRASGIQFENTLSISFEYSARPIGGVNPKAALLDILSNFLVIGSASAVFWGGQHRFMGQPQKYPFIGGDKGIQQWYRGDPIGWGKTTMSSVAESSPGFLDSAGDFFKQILGVFSAGSMSDSKDAVKKMFTGGGKGNIASNLLKGYAAERSSGQIPYLQGMKALLIGEPVGEWHLTIGNPLNPIAMIGNLILDHIEIGFNDELGPDDFPTELKVTVILEHGMARDRDAIQSIFNRGMGRIYELPDDFSGSADFETAVDKNTQDNGKYSKTGRNPIYYKVPIADSRTTGGKFGASAQRPNAMGGEVSIWKKTSYFNSISGTQNLDLSLGNIESKSQYASQFRAGDWIQLKSLR